MTIRITPTIFIAVMNVLVMAIINGLQIMTQTPLNYVNKFQSPGADYAAFYEASMNILAGQSPYLTERYVTPPLFALVNLPLALLGSKAASIIFISLVPITLFIAYFLTDRLLKQLGAQDNQWIMVAGAGILVFSYPFYFLFERGNIDGVVLLCVCLFLYFESRWPWQSGMLLAMAIMFKIYPVLLTVWLFVTRRWKVLLWVGVGLLVLAALSGLYWPGFFERVFDRVKKYKFEENGSLVNTIIFLYSLVIHGDLSQIHAQNQTWLLIQIFAVLFYALMFLFVAYADYKLDPVATPAKKKISAFLYFPFMVAVPRVVYHYDFVILLALLPCLDYLWENVSSKWESYVLILITIGVALTQWQAVALYGLTNKFVFNFIPGIGLLFSMVGICLYKFLELKRSGNLNPA
jgi:hypothetical protein